MNAELADIAVLWVEIRQLRARVAALEEQAAKVQTARFTPMLADRIFEVVAENPGIRLRDLMRILKAQGVLDRYRAPVNAVWMTISREPRLYRVAKGRYGIRRSLV